ncbi:hypothetical protein C7405_102123 [Paraburkholderia caballeronis]|uniref:hypothetical protein n=1 Tax=Paraburkholderia caballeronis TaxID=416943 RepID=UPI00106622B0|nr:hypothetical protein [Paraburkholderia caballeronis]TDV37923.1 hypothetical protein C7405_102123 [Paraburkholderia caballeronis]
MRISFRLFSLWLFMLANAGAMCVIGWFTALDIGSPVFLQLGLVCVGYVGGFILDSMWDRWRWQVAIRLHLDDIWDGTCPHRGLLTPDQTWDWYLRRGSPLWLDPKRARPQVSPWDGLKRLEACRMAPPRRRRSNTHRV